MKWLKVIWSEFVAIFVDDASLALAIAVWLAVALGAFRLGLIPEPWQGPALFAGLAAVFLENTLRRARR